MLFSLSCFFWCKVMRVLSQSVGQVKGITVFIEKIIKVYVGVGFKLTFQMFC